MHTVRVRRARSLVLASAGSIGAIMFSMPALAQSASRDASAPQGLDEIVVTARKVAESQQSVPVAVTAFTGAALEKQSAVRISDIANTTSGFTMRIHPANSTSLIVGLRGQVQTDVLSTVDPSVGTYVDEMYWARAYGLNGGLLDLANVQILKGPQGTLFGRNTTGGALLLNSNDPNFDGMSGKASATYGAYNETTGELVINAPASDMIAFRGAIRYSKRDGWAKGVRQFNVATGLADNRFLAPGAGAIRETGARLGNRDEIQGRLKVLAEFSDDVRLLLSGEWFNYKQAGPARQNLYKVQVGSAAFDNVAATTAINAYTDYFRNNPNAAGYDGFDCEFAVTAGLNCSDNLRGNNGVFTDLNTETYTAKLTADTGLGQFKLIGGYRRVENLNNVDLDGSSVLIHDTTLAQNLHQWSVEGQLTGEVLDNRLKYAIGATYFTEAGKDLSYSFTGAAPGGERATSATRNLGFIDNKSYGFYGQLSYAITDRIHLTGGLRYSHDTKGIDIRSAAVGLNGAVASCNAAGAGTIAGATVANDCSSVRSVSFGNTSWTAGIDFKPVDDLLIYAKASRGYRAGGQNFRAFSEAQATPFKPEIIQEEEVGFKSEFFDRRVRLNVAAYYNELKDAQRSAIVPIGGVNTTVAGNAAKVRNYGVEADLTVRPATGLTLTASGSVNKPKYTSFQDPGVAGPLGDHTQERFQQLPESQFSLSGEYTTMASDMVSVTLNADYVWTDKYYTNQCIVARYANDPSSCTAGILGLSGAGGLLTSTDKNGLTKQQIDAAIVAASTTPSSGILNARLTFGFVEDRYKLAFWGRNILDNRDVVSSTTLIAPRRNYVGGVRREPATYGVTASASF